MLAPMARITFCVAARWRACQVRAYAGRRGVVARMRSRLRDVLCQLTLTAAAIMRWPSVVGPRSSIFTWSVFAATAGRSTVRWRRRRRDGNRCRDGIEVRLGRRHLRAAGDTEQEQRPSASAPTFRTLTGEMIPERFTGIVSARRQVGDGRAEMGVGVVPERDTRVAFERSLCDAALHATAASVQAARAIEAGLCGSALLVDDWATSCGRKLCRSSSAPTGTTTASSST